MKKIILLTLLLSAYSYTSTAQNKILFHVKYKPQMRYEQVVNQNYETHMTYSGSKEFMDKLKEKGMENPTIKNKTSTEKMLVTTGSLNGEQFPLTMEFVESTSSDNKKPIPDGTLIYGHAVAGNTPVVDSLSSKEMDEEMKKLLLPVLQSIFSQVSMPKKEVKVGESFSDKTPLSIPVGGLSIDMDITTTYKLISVQNGTANFDVTQVYTMKSDIADYKITATGKGKGAMIYDIANNYYLRYELENTMNMNMDMEQFKLSLKMTNQNLQTTKISSSK